jgi:anti-sigma factor (TIGR02949 family)
MIDCREAVRRMWAYLDHALPDEPLADFESHLETCVACCGELEFSRRLRSMLATSEGALPMSTDVRNRIDRILMVDAEGGSEGTGRDRAGDPRRGD